MDVNPLPDVMNQSFMNFTQSNTFWVIVKQKRFHSQGVLVGPPTHMMEPGGSQRNPPHNESVIGYN